MRAASIAQPAAGSILDIRDNGETLGFIAIDTIVRGCSHGGLRMLPDVSREELALLARAMTLKYGFLGLPQGGAKAGVIGPAEAPPEVKAAVLARFARGALHVLRSRQYIPDADMGTSGPEVEAMLRSAGVRVPRREHRGLRSGYYTALTTYAGAAAAAGHLGLPLAGARVTIEGFGKVGSELAQLFAAHGACVVAVSTSAGGLYHERGLDVAGLRRLAGQYGSAFVERFAEAERVSASDVLEVPADILCPCARQNSINAGNVGRIAARILSCGANAPVTGEAGDSLWRRGAICVPDFVANCGGVLGGTMEFAGCRASDVEDVVMGVFRSRVRRLLSVASDRSEDLREVAGELAMRRFSEVKAQAERWTPMGWVFRLGLHCYRGGLVPPGVVRHFSSDYFERCAGGY
jgi:glutamate dehydrogenase (NAD(P)+)